MRAFSFIPLLLCTMILPAMAQDGFSTTASVASVSVADLLSAKKESWIGQPIMLRNVQVRDVTRRQAMWVGTSPEQMILITMPAIVRPLYSDGRQAQLNKGDIVTVNGVVQTAPLPHQLREGWGVDRVDAEVVQTTGVILNGLHIEVVQSSR